MYLKTVNEDIFLLYFFAFFIRPLIEHAIIHLIVTN